MTETRLLNVSFAKTTSNGITHIISFPKLWANYMDISKENNAVIAAYENNSIIIKKAYSPCDLSSVVRRLSISFNSMGNGYYATKLTLPNSWLKDMKITLEDRTLTLTYDSDAQTVIIKKEKKDETSEQN